MRCTVFAITFFHRQRQKFLSSQLDGIDGLGPKRKQNLMKHLNLSLKSRKLVDEIVEVGVPRVAAAEDVKRKLNLRKKWIGSSGGRKSGLPNKGDYDEP